MIRGIFILLFLGILAAVINWLPIPAPFSWLIMIMLIIVALYIVALMLGLISRPGWWGPTSPLD